MIKKVNNMKKKIYIVLVMFASLAVVFNGCKKSELEELYPDPGKTSVATVPQFFTGLLASANEVVLPWYWRFFVVEQPTLGLYTQAMGIQNAPEMYVPGASPVDWRWNQFYNGPMTKYRVFQSLYNDLSEEEQAEQRIFYLAATVFFYDQSQQVVDLFGDIPWSEAGMVREIGDLDEALPKYDAGADIYAAIITDLKAIAQELHGISVDSYTAGIFANKDYINHGVVTQWEKYANSLRLRMLARASAVSLPGINVAQEATEILGNPGTWPVVESNDENIMLIGDDALQATTSSGTGGIRQAMETWGVYDIAPKAVCDFMVNNSDPRLEVMFDPNVNGEYAGLDPLMNGTQQTQAISDGLVARYDTATYTRNNHFPGWIIGAAEVYFLKAEAAVAAGLDGQAKAAYEMGIRMSIEHYYNINKTGDYREPLPDPTVDAVATYLSSADVNWDTNANKLNLIATQKWLDFGLATLTQTWSEMRRFDAPHVDLSPDNSSASGQTMPPMRYKYPSSEQALNADNYSAVANKDKLTTKIFWDVN
jgi:hypothetical protein